MLKKSKEFLTDTNAQAIVEYILVVTVLIFGTLTAVNGVTLFVADDADKLIRIPGFKDAINSYLEQIYHLLHIMIP